MAKAPAKQDKKPEAAAEGEGEAQPKKKGKLPLVLALVVGLAGAGGGAAWFFMSEKGDDAPHETKAAAPKPPVFVPLEAFTVNLSGEQNEQYLQVMATLKVLDAPAGDQVKLYMPEIRHKVLLLLSAKKASEVSSSQGREQLSEEIRQVTNNILLVAAGKAPPSAGPIPAQPVAATPAQAAAEQDEAAQAQQVADKPEAAQEPESATAAPAAASTPAEDDPVQSVFFTSFIIQ